jgi:hypothetical protein
MQLLIFTTLLASLTAVTSLLTESFARDQLGPDGCHCTEGYIGQFCGGMFPFLYGNCNPNNVYFCFGPALLTGYPLVFINCPAKGLSCKDGRYRGGGGNLGTDYFDV